MATKSTAEKTAAASDAEIEADVEDVIDGEAPAAATLSDDDIARQLTAESLTKDYVLASVAASIVPVAIFDIAAVVAIQLRMIQKLSQLYGKPFTDKMGRKVIYALAGGVLGYGAGYAVAASATKLIPGIGWMVGMVSLPVVAGASLHRPSLRGWRLADGLRREPDARLLQGAVREGQGAGQARTRPHQGGRRNGGRDRRRDGRQGVLTDLQVQERRREDAASATDTNRREC